MAEVRYDPSHSFSCVLMQAHYIPAVAVECFASSSKAPAKSSLVIPKFHFNP